MNEFCSYITYRGFTPKKIDINYSVKKPDVIYRGFKVSNNQPIESKYFRSPVKIYRGIRMGGNNQYQPTTFSQGLAFN